MADAELKIDVWEVIKAILKEPEGNQVRDKLHRVYYEVHGGEELNFLAAAQEGIEIIVQDIHPDATIRQIASIWADSELLELKNED